MPLIRSQKTFLILCTMYFGNQSFCAPLIPLILRSNRLNLFLKINNLELASRMICCDFLCCLPLFPLLLSPPPTSPWRLFDHTCARSVRAQAHCQELENRHSCQLNFLHKCFCQV